LNETATNGEPPTPPQLVRLWNNAGATTPADFYLALDYIPYTRTNYQGVPGSDVLTCPVAIARLDGKIHRITICNYGHAESHLYFSDLIFQSAAQYGIRRTNFQGPYKSEELKDAANTFFCGDGNVHFSNIYSDGEYAFWFRFPRNGTETSTCFGAIITGWLTGSYMDNPPYYHQIGGPQAACWDGHVVVVSPPPLSTPQRHSDAPVARRD